MHSGGLILLIAECKHSMDSALFLSVCMWYFALILLLPLRVNLIIGIFQSSLYSHR